jgi:hypothetical protein
MQNISTKARELWPFTILIGLFTLLFVYKAWGTSVFQLIGAFGCWIVCWLVLHCVLGETRPKYGAGFVGFASITIVWITVGISPLPFYIGFGLASALMIVQKWDNLSADLIDTAFYNLGSILNLIGLYLVPEPNNLNQGD